MASRAHLLFEPLAAAARFEREIWAKLLSRLEAGELGPLP
jgi:hypothetical protein